MKFHVRNVNLAAGLCRVPEREDFLFLSRTSPPVNVSDAHPAVHVPRVCLGIGVVCVAAREESVISGTILG